ncbi:MAG: hypothetical protein Q9183_004088 [Haloplaca sp. 2 TL-2023]
MSSAYVPPHARSKQPHQQPTSTSPLPRAALSLDTEERRPPGSYTTGEIANQFSFPLENKTGTLNEGQDGLLAFVLVFKDQHPEWPSRILCKSKLHLLASSEQSSTGTAQPVPVVTKSGEKESANPVSASPLKETSPSSTLPGKDHSLAAGGETKGNGERGNGKSKLSPRRLPLQPIAVFTQDGIPDSSGPEDPLRTLFIFKDWYHINSVTYLEPKSQELIKLLEGKFTAKGKMRRPEQWERSLGLRWAVAELVSVSESGNRDDDDQKKSEDVAGSENEDEGRGKAKLGNPMVPLKPMPELPKKSVKDILAEMRLRDGVQRTYEI